MTGFTWPVIAVFWAQRSEDVSWFHRRQLPVRPRETTVLPVGDQRPVQKPPVLPVAVVEPFSALISPSRAMVTQTPVWVSGSQMARELSADADRSWGFLFEVKDGESQRVL